MKRGLMYLSLFLMISCKFQTELPPASDNPAAMNGIWELTAVECADGASRVWSNQVSQHPVNARRQVNNGQTIDYVVDSESCLQTTTGHLVRQGGFLFQYFGYQKYCNEKCGSKISGCGPLNTNSLARIQVIGEEMLISENDSGMCAGGGQAGPVTQRYKLLSKKIQ
ncbi:MAG: hypothetical protein ABL958_05295 [Bdellovibrionia bacterium]